MKQRLFLIAMSTALLVAIFSAQSFGQFQDKGVRIGIGGGFLHGSTEKANDKISGAVRGFLRHNICDYLDGDLAGTYGGIKGTDYQADLWLAEYKLLYEPWQSDLWDPYIGGGLGYGFYEANKTFRSNAFPKSGYVGYIPLTVGVEYAVADGIQLDLNGSYNYSFSDAIVTNKRTNSEGGGFNDAWWGVFASVSVTIFGGGPSAAELEAIRVKAEQDALRARELAKAEAKRVQDSINAVAAEAARVKEAQAAEARRLQEAAEAKRVQDSISAAAQRLAESKKPVELKPEVGKAIILEGVVFKSGSAVVASASDEILMSAKKTLVDNPEIEVQIQGFTDNLGSPKTNLKLSQKRAEAVKAWLVKNGITASRITAKGFGDKNPIGDNSTPEGRQKNRRIEFFRTK